MNDRINNEFLMNIQNKIEKLSADNFIFKNRISGCDLPEGFDKRNADIYIPSHNHPYKEILITLEGSFYIELEGQYYHMSSGNLCYIESGIFHNTLFEKCSRLSRILWISVDNGKQRMHISSYYNTEYKVLDGVDIEMDSYLIEKIEDELIYKRHDFIEYSICFLQAFWKSLVREYEKNSDQITDERNWKKKIMLEVEEYIYNHISEKITLKEISDSVKLSPNYLSFLFKEVMGVNLFEYVQTRKIKKAMELLKVWDGNISEVAYLMGFNDPFYFTKVFKKIVGKSPREYRQKLERMNEGNNPNEFL